MKEEEYIEIIENRSNLAINTILRTVDEVGEEFDSASEMAIDVLYNVIYCIGARTHNPARFFRELADFVMQLPSDDEFKELNTKLLATNAIDLARKQKDE